MGTRCRACGSGPQGERAEDLTRWHCAHCPFLTPHFHLLLSHCQSSKHPLDRVSLKVNHEAVNALITTAASTLHSPAHSAATNFKTPKMEAGPIDVQFTESAEEAEEDWDQSWQEFLDNSERFEEVNQTENNYPDCLPSSQVPLEVKSEREAEVQSEMTMTEAGETSGVAGCPCTRCHRIFATTTRLLLHKCRSQVRMCCGREWASSFLLQRHRKHGQCSFKEPKYNCPLCGKTYLYIRPLSNHVKKCPGLRKRRRLQ